MSRVSDESSSAQTGERAFRQLLDVGDAYANVDVQAIEGVIRKAFSENNQRRVLTHESFYPPKRNGEPQGNGRYIFAGMFVFKGQVGEILYKYISGSGTHLQHILGNLFRNDFLVRLYDTWHLGQYVRAGENFDIEKHKHIFVYAVLGYLAEECEENVRNYFIFKYILGEENNHLFGHQKKNRDLLAHADFISRQMGTGRLNIEMSVTEDGLHMASVKYADGSELCSATSKSWQYARRKAAKLALNIVATPGRKALLSNPDYQERIRLEEEHKIEARRAEIEARTEAKALARIKKEESLSEIKRLRDTKRRQSQSEAKRRKAKNAAMAAAKAAKESRPLSARKRRHLEDKQK